MVNGVWRLVCPFLSGMHTARSKVFAFGLVGGGIVEVVDDVSVDAGYGNGIHGVVAMVDALFVEALLQIEGHPRLEIPLAIFAHVFSKIVG